VVSAFFSTSYQRSVEKIVKIVEKKSENLVGNKKNSIFVRFKYCFEGIKKGNLGKKN